jgi:hypothetical protein
MPLPIFAIFFPSKSFEDIKNHKPQRENEKRKKE